MCLPQSYFVTQICFLSIDLWHLNSGILLLALFTSDKWCIDNEKVTIIKFKLSSFFKECGDDLFYCDFDMSCVPGDYVCDGEADCTYQEDETQCK